MGLYCLEQVIFAESLNTGANAPLLPQLSGRAHVLHAGSASFDPSPLPSVPPPPPPVIICRTNPEGDPFLLPIRSNNAVQKDGPIG